MDYLNELLLKLEFIEERLFPKSQKRSDQLQDLFQQKFGVTEHCQFHLSSTVRIADSLHTLTDEREAKLLFEILEKRSEMKLSTFICSQRDPKSWSAMILNDEVSANAILKRATKHFTVLIRPKSAT